MDSAAVANFNLFKKSPLIPCTCATCFELPSYVSTMVLIHTWWMDSCCGWTCNRGVLSKHGKGLVNYFFKISKNELKHWKLKKFKRNELMIFLTGPIRLNLTTDYWAPRTTEARTQVNQGYTRRDWFFKKSGDCLKVSVYYQLPRSTIGFIEI